MSETAVAPPRARTPLLARCGMCEHEWAVLYLPIRLYEAVQRFSKAAPMCPNCGEASWNWEHCEIQNFTAAGWSE